ncbi:MAG TPA: site-2 protease family protein [Nitrolancea sp.]|nr:site-2 protease family protein [Nitrolancea sp.]
MGSGIGLLTIRGIKIKLHPSIVLALAWVVYHWDVSARHGWAGAGFGFVLLLGIFACVVGHELAHGFLAQRYGLAVHDIVLLPIGGVARIEHLPLSARREAMIALAGPLLNLLVALGLTPLLLAIVLTRHLASPLAILSLAGEIGFSGLIFQFWFANLMLALFNLLPAFPMDGGRIFRAAVAGLSNRLTATQVASLVGQGFALLIVVVGLLAHDLMLPLLALFIVASAYVESRLTRLEDVLRKLPVAQFAVWDMGGIDPEAPLSFALRGGARDVAVVDRGIVVGMLWREQILSRLSGAAQLRACEVMDTTVTPMSVDDSVFSVHQQMLARRQPAIPITAGGRYRGVFTAERLAHVYRHLQRTSTRRLSYRDLAEALGLIGR